MEIRQELDSKNDVFPLEKQVFSALPVNPKDFMVNSMNTKLKLVRFVVAVTFGSLLWAGCASDGYDYEARSYTSSEDRPVDLTKRRADTFPERRTGLEDRNRELNEGPIFNEAAGAERLY